MMTKMLERSARAIHDADQRRDPIVPDWEWVSQDAYMSMARAVLMAVREPDEAFMCALYPDPELIVADRGRAAGMRSRRAGRMQIAHFIDTILSEAP